MNVNKIRVNMEDYYSSLHNLSLPVYIKHIKRQTTCRVCLQDGNIPLDSVANPNEMIEALSIYGNIEIEDDIENRTYLCYVCYKFLKSAILFRKVAHRTNETLKMEENDKPNQINSRNKFQRKKKRWVAECAKVKCPVCNKILNKNYYYKIHLLLHNPNLPDQYVCDICGKAFKLKKVYSGHMKRHETRFLFKCQLCPYVGRYKERLSTHMHIHTGELNYLCTQCPARYLTKSRLNDHVKYKHTKPEYKCSYCVKAFHNNLDLQRHIDAVHMGMRDHVCDICNRAFSYRRLMLRHQRLVHKSANLKPIFSESTNRPIINNS